MDKLFHKARLKLTLLYTTGIIFVFSVGYGFNLLFDKILPESQVDPLLFVLEVALIVITVIASFWLAGRTLRPVADSYQQQKKFIADAAHELRTPLAVIKTGADVTLAGQPTQKDYQKLTMDTLQEVNYMTTTVNDLLFLAHGDAQKIPAFTRVCLTELVIKQTELMQPYAHKKNVILSHNCQAECFVRGNQMYLKRLLTNLLQNAIDYNNSSGTATLSLTKTSQQVTLKIIDTGIGMGNSTLAHIFERFYKADPSRTIQSSGAGLGLSIVQEIAISHSGQISVQSQLESGTSVSIILPAYS